MIVSQILRSQRGESITVRMLFNDVHQLWLHTSSRPRKRSRIKNLDLERGRDIILRETALLESKLSIMQHERDMLTKLKSQAEGSHPSPGEAQQPADPATQTLNTYVFACLGKNVLYTFRS